MTFRVTLSETAVRQLRKLPSDQRNRVVRGLRVLEEDPFRPRPRADIRTIEGTDPRKYRIRIGDYRAVYAVLGRGVKILELFTRGRGYR